MNAVTRGIDAGLARKGPVRGGGVGGGDKERGYLSARTKQNKKQDITKQTRYNDCFEMSRKIRRAFVTPLRYLLVNPPGARGFSVTPRVTERWCYDAVKRKRARKQTPYIRGPKPLRTVPAQKSEHVQHQTKNAYNSTFELLERENL